VTVWNTFVGVVDHVEAATEEEAIETLRARIAAAGLNPYIPGPGTVRLYAPEKSPHAPTAFDVADLDIR
jgi:hypothetical protein